MGKLLGETLAAKIRSHPNVGDIRGRGLFWGIEFVSDKKTALPFPAHKHVAMAITELGLSEQYGVAVYPGSGTADGVNGDHSEYCDALSAICEVGCSIC
jgi:adenosylmethionine-8-amino-7-oxononanoate aminotransferase